MMVLVTIESTSCGVTRPYQIPDPEGVYNCMSREIGKHVYQSINQRRCRYEYLGSTAMQNGTFGNEKRTTWRVLTIQLPAYRCPPTCETLTINARFASELCFSCAEIFSSFSSGVTLRSSKGGPIVSEGCSSCVSASQPCASKDLMNAIETHMDPE